MRQIGTIESAEQAQRFVNYLESQGIGCSADSDGARAVVWVYDEDRVAQAKEELARFQTEPDHERYRTAGRKAPRERPAARPRSRQIDLRERWTQPTMDRGPVTFGLMALMILVAVLTGLEPNKHEAFLIRMLFSPDGTLSAIQQGEVWRLISPIFLHFGLMHFLFNLIYLRDFGLLTEDRLGTPRFLGLVAITAILSNFAQFAMVGPMFGGMSGVNYGLFGFAWVRSRLDPNSGFWVHPNTVVIMLGWHVLCMLGVIPNVANWAHGVGLTVGVVLGASRPLLRGAR